MLRRVLVPQSGACALVLDRERAILAGLAAHLSHPLAEADVLDVGCGVGTSLALLAAYGAEPQHLHGVDILDHRIAAGRRHLPNVDLQASDGASIPHPDETFDLVQQITMLSSVHDQRLRESLAAEMLRVLRPGGLVLSYDVAPVGLLPRLTNRALSPRRHRQPPSETAAAPPVTLTPVRPLNRTELAALFPLVETLVARRLTPYRPLATRALVVWPVFDLLLRLPPFSSMLLFIGRKTA